MGKYLHNFYENAFLHKMISGWYEKYSINIVGEDNLFTLSIDDRLKHTFDIWLGFISIYILIAYINKFIL